MQISSAQTCVDFQSNSFVAVNAKLEPQEVFFQKFSKMKITPTNNNYNQILNMGFVKINENRSVLSCFIGNCRYKTYICDDFQRHIKSFHENDKEILKNFCLICETVQCGESLDNELLHMIDHINGKLFENNEDNNFIKRETPMEFIEAKEEPVVYQAETEIQDQLSQIVSMTTVQEFNEVLDYLEEPSILTQLENVEESIRNYDVNISTELDETPSLLEPIETPFKMPQIPIRKSQMRNQSQTIVTKMTARKSTSTINARRSTIDFFQAPVKEEPKEILKVDKKIPTSLPSKSNKIKSRRMTLATDRPMTSTRHPQIKNLLKSPTAKLDNKKLEETECFAFIKKKIQNAKKKEDKFANIKLSFKDFLEAEGLIEKSPTQVTIDCLSFISKEVKKASNENTRKSKTSQNSDQNSSSTSSERNLIKKRKNESESSQPSKIRKVLGNKNNFTYEAIMAVPRENSKNRVALYLENLEKPSEDDKNDDIEVPESYEEFVSPQRNKTLRKAATSAQKAIKQQVQNTTEFDNASCQSDSTFESASEGDESHFDTTIVPHIEKPKKSKQSIKLAVVINDDNNSSSAALKFQNLTKLYPWIDEKKTRTIFKTEASINVLLSEICQFSTFKCMNEVCIYFTTDFDEFKKHIIQHSDSNCHYCCFCLGSFEKTVELSSHIDMSHRYDRFQCSRCLYRSCQKSYVDIHQKKFHPDENCEIFKSPVQKLLKNTLKKVEESMVKNREQFVHAYRCKTPRCKETFYSKINFRKHLETEADKPNCVEFGSIICEQLYEIDHQRTFNNLEGTAQCLYCKFGTDGNNILEHMALKHQSEFAYICKRVMPTYIVARETLMTHTSIEYVGAHPAETKNFDGNLEDLKSENIVANIKLEPELLNVPVGKFNDEIIMIED